jgi:hypothetical protein
LNLRSSSSSPLLLLGGNSFFPNPSSKHNVSEHQCIDLEQF